MKELFQRGPKSYCINLIWKLELCRTMFIIWANAYLLWGHDVFCSSTAIKYMGPGDTCGWGELISLEDGVIQLCGGVSKAKMRLPQREA